MQLGGIDLWLEPRCTPEEFARSLETHEDDHDRHGIARQR
jgi:hypothetical protein